MLVSEAEVLGLACPDKMRRKGAANTFSSPSPKVFFYTLGTVFFSFSPPPSLRLQSFQVQALTLLLASCQEAGKPEEGFDHSRSLITVNEYANEVATLTPPLSPRTTERERERERTTPGMSSKTT